MALHRHHTPTLFTHRENDSDSDDDGESWEPSSFTAPVAASSSATKPRIKHRSRSSHTATSSTPKYSDVYSQFVRRYRSGPGANDPRDDPDSHFYQRGYGQLIDGGESDDEDLLRGSVGSGGDVLDRLSALMLESELKEPATREQRERLEWQTMLASVLGGDVLKSEKSRLASTLESSVEEQNERHVNIWLGIQAKLHGRSEEEQRKKLEEQRLRLVDAAIHEVINFRVSDSATDPTAALKEVKAVIARLDVAQSLYPTLKAFFADKAAAAEGPFQARCDILYTWSTVLTSLRKQIALLRKWTGSETLDVTQPNTDPELPIGAHSKLPRDGDVPDGTTFVDRVLKEDSSQRTFEKGFLTTVHSLIGTARDAQVNLAPYFREMNLPTFEKELVPLISFPTKLVQAILRVRLDYATKLKDPEILIIDQMAEDLKINIGLACTLKRQYEAFLAPDPDGNWNLPSCISKDYDLVVLEALSFFFKLMHWKLKAGAKSIYFKETDVLEGQWATFNDVSLSTSGGSSLVAEQLCALMNKLMVRVTNYFENQVRVPTLDDGIEGTPAATYRTPDPNGSSNGIRPLGMPDPLGARKKMNDEQIVSWYSKVLDSGRLRHRRLQRFARLLTLRFSNAAEYSLDDVPMDHFIATLVDTDHVLVYTRTYEEDGTYIVAPHQLRDRPETIRRILTEAFQVHEVFADDGTGRLVNSGEPEDEEERYDEDAGYVLVLSPRTQFLWNGLVLMLDIPKVDLDIEDNRVRLIADGARTRLALAKEQFGEIFLPYEEEGETIEPPLGPLQCVIEQRPHLPSISREVRKISRAANRLAESVVDSVHHVRESLRGAQKHQDLLENWYVFASEHGQHAQKYMDRSGLVKFNRLLIKLAISWVAFICDDCDPNDRKTFRWAVNALEFALHRTRRNNILQLPEDQFEMLRQKVASCMTLLISHFDILGARSIKEKERQEEILRQQALNASNHDDDDEFARPTSPDADGSSYENDMMLDKAVRMFWERTARAVMQIENERYQGTAEQHVVGRVLEDKPENRSLAFLASSSSNIGIRWRRGQFIGAGAFGSVYLAVNLDSGSPMAVKEIKFQELSGMPNLYSQIKDELNVMEMLHHPNVVEYYGIEVHRDKVYIFEEYCQGGSLASLLEHGRIEDEGIIQVYTMQMLEGLAYLHSQGIVHRDIKPDNILLDHLGVIKFVDFGAAKVLAKNQRTMQRSRRAPAPAPDPGLPPGALGGGLGMNNSLTGTPMYMSPEVIKNDKRGRHGAMDVWSLGCVVLECATGRKPWSNLDNEWAIMFHIGVATQHPPLPEPNQLSETGISFIKRCLTIDPMKRPSANEMMDHPWMLEFRQALLSYEENEMASDPPAHLPPDEMFDHATVARQAAIMQEKETEDMLSTSPDSTPAVESPEAEGGAQEAL